MTLRMNQQYISTADTRLGLVVSRVVCPLMVRGQAANDLP